jgi:hypothetical protein
MRINGFVVLVVVAVALLAPVAAANAQIVRKPVAGDAEVEKWKMLELIEIVESLPESISHIGGAPFSADAVTEFTQVLGDGNRIERRYSSFIARDARGRTRREEELVLPGPLAVTGPTPKLVTIVDPVTRTAYTLDQSLRAASRNPLDVVVIEMVKNRKAREAVMAGPVMPKKVESDPRDPDATTVTAESLGRRSIEGVMAEGTRTTSTIPAGTIGNLQRIEIISERWFSPELQVPVLITRRDPRSGETVHRLINIVRAEPSADLFIVPPDYDVRDGSVKKSWTRIGGHHAK